MEVFGMGKQDKLTQRAEVWDCWKGVLSFTASLLHEKKNL